MRNGRVRASSIPGLEAYGDVRPLGRGGQGDVFVAVHRDLGRRVAVKVLRRDVWRSESAGRRFDREIELVAGLQHPNIVRIYESGITDDDRRFYAMEYIDGAPLDAYLSRAAFDGTPLSIRERLMLIVRVVDAVAFAHQNGVIHRDLKPGNILIDARGEPHLLDFGLATWTAGSTSLMTMTGEFLGTLSYAAPEQVGAGRNTTDVRTDVYALGVILYELLTGEPLVPPGLALAEAVRAIVETEPSPPGKRVRQHGNTDTGAAVDSDLDAVAMKAMAKRPEDRYQLAAELRDDVRRYLLHEPVAARRASGWYILTRMIRRHSVAATAAAIVLATLIGSTASMTVLYRRAAAETAKAQQINVFLEDTLGSVSPETPGESVSLMDVLSEAVHWVDIALENQPEVAASVRTTIGNSFRSLGVFDRAECELETALMIRRELYGPSHADVATSLNSIALLRRDQGRPEEAESLFREVLGMRRDLLGDRSLPVAQVEQNLGALMMMQGNWSEAAEFLAVACEIRRDRLGNDHPDTLMCRFQLGSLALLTGDLDEAKRIHESVLKARRVRLHPDHPDIARSCRVLGDLASQLGNYSSAVNYHRECYALLTSNRGCRHPMATEAAGLLAEALRAAGNDAEAREVMIRHAECVFTARE